MEQILVKRVRDGAKIPVRSTEGSAGYDLFACIDSTITLFPDKRVLIPTGISVALPDSHSAIFIYARSSLGVKHGIIPANCVGVIDSDYRGEILVALYNTSDTAYRIEPDERIAQMVVQPIYTPIFSEVEELPETERGEGGFGSTGRS